MIHSRTTNRLLLAVLPMLLLLVCWNCGEDKGTDSDDKIVPLYDSVGTMTDIDGNVYNTVKIGDQWWMAENLAVIHYRNGDPITNITSPLTWSELPSSNTGAYCCYSNNTDNIAIYGLLYNWYAVDDDRRIAPEGWHIPTYSEWMELSDYLGENATGKMKETGTAHWESPNEGATNASGFTALPGGMREDNGEYWGLTYYAYFWTSTSSEPGVAVGVSLGYAGVPGALNGGGGYWWTGRSIRCVKD